MPIAGIICPCQDHKVWSLDHYSGSECPLSPSEKNWYRWIIQREQNDTRHADGKLSPTRLLTCPREVLLQDFLPYTINVKHASSRAAGTKIHEVSSGSPLLLRGTLFGLSIEGECDNHERLPGEGWWIDDTKSHGDFREANLRKEGLHDEVTVQLNIYRFLFEQMGLGKVSRLTASHFSPYSGFRCEDHPLMGDAWIAGVRPLGNPFTVAQIAGFYQNALAALAEPKIEDEDLGGYIAQACPKVGAEMLKQKSGSWKCAHCDVREMCDGLG